MTAPAPLPDQIPTVTDADVSDDQQLFADHPRRQYRLRPGWAVRRRARGVFLRTPLPADRVRWTAAFPYLSPLARAELAKAARWRTNHGGKP